MRIAKDIARVVNALVLCTFHSAAAATAVAHWKITDGRAGVPGFGAGTIQDSSPNHLDSTPFGGPIFDDVYPCNIGLQFDGLNDRVFVPDSPPLALTKSLTVETVIRLDALPLGLGGQYPEASTRFLSRMHDYQFHPVCDAA